MGIWAMLDKLTEWLSYPKCESNMRKNTKGGLGVATTLLTERERVYLDLPYIKVKNTSLF